MAIPALVPVVIEVGPPVAEALGVLLVAAGAAGTGISVGRAFDAYTSIDASDLMDRRMRQTSGELRECQELCKAMIYAEIDGIKWLNANLSGRPLENMAPLTTMIPLDPPDLRLLFLPMMSEELPRDDRDVHTKIAHQSADLAESPPNWDDIRNDPRRVLIGGLRLLGQQTALQYPDFADQPDIDQATNMVTEVAIAMVAAGVTADMIKTERAWIRLAPQIKEIVGQRILGVNP